MILIALRGNKEYWNALENEFLLQKNRELEEISRIDILTKIIGDIHCFKAINDTHGYLAGDFF